MLVLLEEVKMPVSDWDDQIKSMYKISSPSHTCPRLCYFSFLFRSATHFSASSLQGDARSGHSSGLLLALGWTLWENQGQIQTHARISVKPTTEGWKRCLGNMPRPKDILIALARNYLWILKKFSSSDCSVLWAVICSCLASPLDFTKNLPLSIRYCHCLHQKDDGVLAFGSEAPLCHVAKWEDTGSTGQRWTLSFLLIIIPSIWNLCVIFLLQED